jgi:hypothetical protein
MLTPTQPTETQPNIEVAEEKPVTKVETTTKKQNTSRGRITNGVTRVTRGRKIEVAEGE